MAAGHRQGSNPARVRASAGTTSRFHWHGIDCREWFIKMLADDYHAEMETIDRMIEAELRR